MKILITGICGFVGSHLARILPQHLSDLQIIGIDNLLRPGSELNRARFHASGTQVFHGDIRMRSDIEALPAADWVIDAAANPSVLAGVDGKSSPRQVSEHNLNGTLNILEYCRAHSAGFILLSTSRVYSVRALADLPMRAKADAFELDTAASLPEGVSASGISETFSVHPPISLYGATKLSSEVMALEYSHTFRFPIWVNRCGVLAGAGQFGTAEQGIFSYWLHAHAARKPLRYIGFGGRGFQVRDAMHPSDLAALIARQLQSSASEDPLYNVGGGPRNAMSLAQLTVWCDRVFSPHVPTPDSKPRAFDIPWFVMDSARVARDFGWRPAMPLPVILDEIAQHVRDNPDWLSRCGAQ